MADGDDTYPADAAPAMVAKVLEGYDMVIGDRLSSTTFQENKAPVPQFRQPFGGGSINGLFRRARHRHHDRITARSTSPSSRPTPVLSARPSEVEGPR